MQHEIETRWESAELKKIIIITKDSEYCVFSPK